MVAVTNRQLGGKMKAELIAVGTEILTGQIVNTNAQFLSEKLAALGIDVYFQTAVGDNEARLQSVLEIAKSRSNLVILCGGLGPTEDDLTKQTLAKFLGKPLVFDPLASQKLDDFFATRPQYARTPNNECQAQIIEGSLPIHCVWIACKLTDHTLAGRSAQRLYPPSHLCSAPACGLPTPPTPSSVPARPHVQSLPANTVP